MKKKVNTDKISISIKKVVLFIPLIIMLIYLNKKYNIYIPCIFHKITGLYCPGCGVTRMLISILNLNFYQAFRYNPLIFILLPFIITYYILYYIYWLQNKKIIIRNELWYTLLIIIILYGIIRNIPIFKYLIPTKI